MGTIIGVPSTPLNEQLVIFRKGSINVAVVS
jgi:hypothetical protein